MGPPDRGNSCAVQKKLNREAKEKMYPEFWSTSPEKTKYVFTKQIATSKKPAQTLTPPATENFPAPRIPGPARRPRWLKIVARSRTQPLPGGAFFGRPVFFGALHLEGVHVPLPWGGAVGPGRVPESNRWAVTLGPYIVLLVVAGHAAAPTSLGGYFSEAGHKPSGIFWLLLAFSLVAVPYFGKSGPRPALPRLYG